MTKEEVVQLRVGDMVRMRRDHVGSPSYFDRHLRERLSNGDIYQSMAVSKEWGRGGHELRLVTARGSSGTFGISSYELFEEVMKDHFEEGLFHV